MNKILLKNWRIIVVVFTMALSISLLIYTATAIQNSHASLTILAVIGLIIFIFVILIFIYQRQTRISQTLMDATRALAKGKFTVRIKSEPGDEFEEIANSFNHMASALQKDQQQLKSRVNATTRELRDTLKAVEEQNVQLDLARRHALEVSQEKTAFLANMSHEIRTPMNGLLGFIDLLLRTPLNAEQRDYTSTIRKSAANLLIIVNDILDFSKIESNKLVIDSQPFNLREALEDSVDLMAPVAHEKNLELVLLIYSDVPVNLFGDSSRIRQILLNLIGNAIKFTEQGTVTVRAMLDEEESPQETHPSIRISVSDTGMGVSEEQRQNLFKAFSQLDNSPAKRHGGTGLGLFISRNLVEAMHGRIGVESELGKGAHFWFSLPLEVQRDVTLQPAECVLDRPLHAILFDQHNLTRLALRHPLEDWGFKVEEATNVPVLLNNINPEKHALIIVGLANNSTEQTEQSRALLTELARFKLPVVAMLNEIDHDRLQTWCKAGASICITKPARRESLHRALWQVLKLPEEESSSFIDRRTTPRPVMPNLTGATFLLADDNEINRKLITLQLESLGVHVDTAINGEEAIWFARRKAYDLILMDLHMPGMSGDESTQEIRKHSELNQHTPIIAITANIFLAESEELSAHGFSDYLIKPISEYSLWDMIKRWIGREVNEFASGEPSETLKTLSQRPEVMQDLLDLLTRELPEQRLNITHAFNERDWRALRQHAHKLNGSAAYCKVEELHSAAAALEQAAFAEDEHQIDDAYVACCKAIERLLTASAH